MGMSATVSNAAALAQWLNARLCQTELRPVPLRKLVKVVALLYPLNTWQAVPCMLLTAWRCSPAVSSLQLLHRQVGQQLRDVQGTVVREVSADAGWMKEDADHTVLLCKETMDAGKSVLVFCGTKKVCTLWGTCMLSKGTGHCSLHGTTVCD